MDVGRSFTYITEDQDWIKKVLLGGVIMLIPIAGPFFVFGYVLAVMKNVMAGQETPLPELDDFGGKIIEGLKGWVIAIVYMLPMILFIICGQSGTLAPVLAENMDPDFAGILATVAMIVSLCCACLAILYAVVAGLILPFAWGKYLETGELGAAFQFAELWEMLKNNIGPAFIVLLVSWLALFVAQLVGMILCVVGMLFTMFYAQLVMAFLYGALYRQAKATPV
jgi:hypothetical protein